MRLTACVSRASKEHLRRDMLATQPADPFPQNENVKQWIKEKIAYTLKTLQKRYVTTDAPVTSEDSDANQLCSALEAVFIHGLRSKYIRSDGGRARNRKGGSLPEPTFWNLLKSITHRDVILELDGLSFINSDVGRCRAWVRLALNDGLMECYMMSLLREGNMLDSYYQPGALLLDPEEREVLLSLLQGLASLAFQLSYKSAVLNEWTTTPLVLAGLCSVSADDLQLPNTRRESWDTASHSSGSGNSGRGHEGMAASDQSLDTVGSSQLSCSLGSDRGSWGCQTENRNTLDGISSSSSQDLDVPSPTPESMNDSSTHSGSEDDAFKISSNNQDEDQKSLPSTAAPFLGTIPIALELALSVENLNQYKKADDDDARPELTEASVMEEQKQNGNTAPMASDAVHPISPSQISPDLTTTSTQNSLDSSANELLNSHPPVQRSLSALSRQISSGSIDSYNKSTSWISEEDFYKPERYESQEFEDSDILESATSNETPLSPVSESELNPSPPSVVHRRQMGLANPFRGLLKLGQLERRNAMGLWRACHCELSPFELRLFEDEEERAICENCSLLRCENVFLGTDGRFRLEFAKKKLHLRAQNTAEAEDWVERIDEALSKVRHQKQEEGGRPSPSTPPEELHPEPVSVPDADWTRPCDPEPDAIKEAMVLNKEKEAWSLVLLSLSAEALRGYTVKGDHKMCVFSHGIEAVRDVVPDVALGGPAFFKVLMAQGALTIRAESGEEARTWRNLIRGALDLYLDEENGEGEVIPLVGGNIQRLVQHRLKGDGVLLQYLSSIPVQKGLNAQSFRCAGCPKRIGVSLGRARLCEFSGQYYCESCHHGDTSIIPSRMVHNWDLSLYEVSKQAVKLLADIEQEPLLDLSLLNPDLLDHTETMATVQCLRKTLRLLGDYLLICRSGIRKKMEDRLQERKYLLESSNLYSVLDLRQIVDGQYESYLKSLIEMSSHHVHNCVLCTQRGFICQICNADDIIFPFQCDSTARCAVCKTVFHSSCKAPNISCPRCERMQKYKERDMLK